MTSVSQLNRIERERERERHSLLVLLFLKNEITVDCVGLYCTGQDSAAPVASVIGGTPKRRLTGRQIVLKSLSIFVLLSTIVSILFAAAAQVVSNVSSSSTSV